MRLRSFYTGKRRQTRYRMTEETARERFGDDAVKVEGSLEIRQPSGSTSDFGRRSKYGSATATSWSGGPIPETEGPIKFAPPRPGYINTDRLLRHIASLSPWERRVFLRKRAGPEPYPRFRYKYKAIASGTPEQREKRARELGDILIEGRLWLSSPRDFNDPFDMTARVVFEPKSTEALRQRFKEAIDKTGKPWKERQAFDGTHFRRPARGQLSHAGQANYRRIVSVLPQSPQDGAGWIGITRKLASDSGSFPIRMFTHLVRWTLRNYHRFMSVRKARDPTKSARHLLSAAVLGDSWAQNSIGIQFANGTGVPQDYQQALQWFLKAYRQGDVVAPANIAWLYRNGLGVERDVETANQWLVIAAELGHPESEYNLALLYLYGDGVPLDRDKAITLLSSASRKGLKTASACLAYLPGPKHPSF